MAVTVTKLRKRLSGTEVYKNLSFEAKEGRITAIFGPNGSGKTTLFNILSGISKQDGGEVRIPREQLAYLFQNYRESLLPWRTGYKNLSFPLEVRGVGKEERKKRIGMLQKTIRTTIPFEKYPYQMSGGQQQMLAILRTLITEPKIILLDEPFSALDYENALRQRNVLQDYHQKHGGTILIITHDIEEAAYLADEIIVLSHRPARAIGTVRNPLPYPRTLDTLKDERFHRTTAEILKLFRRAMRA